MRFSAVAFRTAGYDDLIRGVPEAEVDHTPRRTLGLSPRHRQVLTVVLWCL